MVRAILPFSILSAVVFTGCTSKVCTLIGCGTSLEVHFTGATDKPGRYQIEVVADGAISSCQFTLPQECHAQPTCTPAGPGWLLNKASCAPGEERRTIDGFTFHTGAPTRVEVVVRRDDTVVGTTSTEPVYKESRPNGPDCSPVCHQGDMTVSIAP
jgi:hypothetical protein